LSKDSIHEESVDVGKQYFVELPLADLVRIEHTILHGGHVESKLL
jgi:hypothetical protein